MAASVCATTRPRLAREGRPPNGAGHVPAGEPEAPELVVWHEFFDQPKELSLLKPDMCVKQLKGANIAVIARGRDGWEDRWHGLLVSLPRCACPSRRTCS